MPDSSDPKKGYAVPRKLLDLVHAPNPDNRNTATPVLDQTEIDQILENVPALKHGGETGEPQYDVRRLTKAGTAAIDLVTLDSQIVYRPHVHDHSESKIFVVDGFGYLILRERERVGDERLHAYKPGDRLHIPRKTYHGFFAISVTHFISNKRS